MGKQNQKDIKEKVNVIIETIELILGDSMAVNGRFLFDFIEEKDGIYCAVEIYVLERNYERHWNMGIPKSQSYSFYKQILGQIIEKFSNLKKVSISDFDLENKDNHFCGIELKNSIGTIISLNFLEKCARFTNLVTFYNEQKNKK